MRWVRFLRGWVCTIRDNMYAHIYVCIILYLWVYRNGLSPVALDFHTRITPYLAIRRCAPTCVKYTCNYYAVPNAGRFILGDVGINRWFGKSASLWYYLAHFGDVKRIKDDDDENCCRSVVLTFLVCVYYGCWKYCNIVIKKKLCSTIMRCE